jgi:hypothetical protein
MKPGSPETKRKPLPPHWYLIHTEECVLCGRGSTWRERMFTPKPEDPADRYSFTQYACDTHFI